MIIAVMKLGDGQMSTVINCAPIRYRMPAAQRYGRTGEALASIDELIALIERDIAKSEESKSSIEASRTEAKELAELFAGMNVDGQAARTGQVEQALADAFQECVAVKEQLEAAKIRAEALKSNSAGGSGDSTVSAAPRGPEESPAGERLIAISQESAEQRGSRLARLGKVAARNGDEVNEKAKVVTDQAAESFKAFRKLPDPPSETASGTSTPPVILHEPYASPPSVGDVTSAVATLALAGAVVYQRITQRKESTQRKPR